MYKFSRKVTCAEWACHGKNGPGKYGPACITVEILRALTIKLTQARARTRARAMARTTARTRLRARARACECVYV